MSRARRVDANQSRIVAELRQVPGVSVFVTSSTSGGYPDICVGHRGRTYLYEIKRDDGPPSARKLTPAEAKFFHDWKGHAQVVGSVDEILTDLFLDDGNSPLFIG